MGLAWCGSVNARAGDPEAWNAAFDELVELDESGAGISLALWLLTRIKLDGIPLDQVPHQGLVPGTVLRAAVAPPSWCTEEELLKWRNALAIVSEIWSGKATGDVGMYVRAVSKVRNGDAALVRSVLKIMGQAVMERIDQFAIWQSYGSEFLDDYRTQHPFPPAPAHRLVDVPPIKESC